MNKIRELRKSKKLSMKELGEAIGGYAESTISLYENNKRQPDQETLIKIADFFGVSIDYLLGHEPSNKIKKEQTIANLNNSKSNILIELTAEEQELINCFRRITVAERLAIITTARSFFNHSKNKTHSNEA